MRVDEIEFADALSSNLNASRIISNMLDSRSIARMVLIVDRLGEGESPSVDVDQGSSCIQVSPYGHPMTVMYNPPRSTRGSKRVRLPLHTFQIFSPPLNQNNMKEVEGAANHLLNCEALSFLSLVSGMVGNNWNESVSARDVPDAIRFGVSRMSENNMQTCAVVCDKGTFDGSLSKMPGFSNEMVPIGGIPTRTPILTVDNKRLRIFTYDVINHDGGVVFLCSQMMGVLYLCGDVKFWIDQSGTTGVFSVRMAMTLMERDALFAIKRKG